MMKKMVLSLLFFLLVLNLSAQSIKKETEFWQSFGIDIRVHKIFKVYLEKQLRYEERLTNLESDIYEMGAKLYLYKFLALRLNYRYTIRKKNKRYRFDGNAYLDFRIKRFDLDFRTRLQSEYIEDGIFNDSELELRNRVQLTYRLNKKIRPYTGLELFTGLGKNNPRERDKIRFSLGVDWRVTGQATITFFYHFQKDLNPDLNDTSHIFGSKFNYSF